MVTGPERSRSRRSPGARASRGLLPVSADVLIGRESELAQARRILCRADVRLLTLVGPPGTGKTRLSQALAEKVAGLFEHGVHFVDLTGVVDSRNAPASIAHALEIRHPGKASVAIEEALEQVLHDHHALLLLDNFEGVLPAAGIVADLLAACPRLKVLVTSREPLQIAGEHQFLVRPLATPAPDASLSLSTLRELGAVALFEARTQAIRPDWQVTHDNAVAVAELCVRLDGLPLAIELAAAWMKTLSLQDMLARSAEMLDLLVDLRPTAPARHQTLRTAIGWSYDLLSTPERAVFRRLAVFEGSWSPEAAHAVCADPDAKPLETLLVLRNLVSKHLVTRSERTTGRSRFGFLGMIRAFAREQMVRAGELDVIRSRHAEFFVALAEQAHAEWDTPAQGNWLDRLEDDRENVRVTLEWCTRSNQPDAVQLGLRLAGAVWFFWDLRGHIREGREPLEVLLGLPDAKKPSVLRGRALATAGWLAYVKGDVEKAAEVLDESVAVAREFGDREGLTRALATLGTALGTYTQELDRADAILCEAVEVGRPLQASWWPAVSVYSRGVVAMRAGRLEQAWRLCDEARQYSALTGNTFGLACTVFRLGWLASASGNLDEAVRLLRESLRLTWELRYQRVLVVCLEQLACLSIDQERPRDLVCLFGAGETLLRQLPDYRLPPQMADARERSMAVARAALGAAAFDDARAAGRKMPLQDAVNLALRSSPSTAPKRDVPPTAFAMGLSTRELEVVRLVTQGLTDRQIGDHLGISHRTVDNHLRRIFAKVGVATRAGLAALAAREAIVA